MPVCSMPSRRFRRGALPLAALALCCGLSARQPAWAAELDGVRFPDTMRVGGTTLYLNGIGLRTYSVARIHIYVAALYLAHQGSDPDAILHSAEPHLLMVTFKHDVSAKASRDAWREGLERNCQAPCQLDPADMAQFLAGVPDMHAGDSYGLFFHQQGAAITLNGQQAGVISKPAFAQALLATFLGPRPAAPELKQNLLGAYPGAAPGASAPGTAAPGAAPPHSALINPR